MNPSYQRILSYFESPSISLTTSSANNEIFQEDKNKSDDNNQKIEYQLLEFVFKYLFIFKKYFFNNLEEEILLIHVIGIHLIVLLLIQFQINIYLMKMIKQIV